MISLPCMSSSGSQLSIVIGSWFSYYQLKSVEVIDVIDYIYKAFSYIKF